MQPLGPGMLRLLAKMYQLPAEVVLALSGTVMVTASFSTGGLYTPTESELETIADDWVKLNCDLDMVDHILIVRLSGKVIIGYLEEGDSLLILGGEGKANRDEIAQYIIGSGSLIIFTQTLANFALL